MVDMENLRTASLYINNQLLSRGLLRDGETINFAEPEHEGGDTTATMARIMSVVNDLILRRDRDGEQRESLSTTMRTLRADNLTLTKDVTKLTEKCSEAQRKLHISESAEISLRAQLKNAETAARGLKDEMARTKALVAQARAACANDVRRRDRQIDAMKKQLTEAGRARGSRGSPGITTVTITSDSTMSQRLPPTSSPPPPPPGEMTASEESYSLRNETNAFLADLAQNLSEENEALLKTMKQAMEQLGEMSGWPGSSEGQSTSEVVRQPGWQELSADLGAVLDHMRTILTNPSFVPLEEVVVREEEILRLKDGWVKMENRWKDAVVLIDGWRKRMATDGKPIGEEELQLGLSLSPVRVRGVLETQGGAVPLALDTVSEEAEETEQDMREGALSQASEPERLEEPQQEDAQDLVSRDKKLQQSEGSENAKPSQHVLPTSGEPTPGREEVSSSPPLPEPPRLSPLKHSANAANRGSNRLSKMGGDHRVKSTTTAEETERGPVAPSFRSLPVRSKVPISRPLPKTRLGRSKGDNRDSLSPAASLAEEAPLPAAEKPADIEQAFPESSEESPVELIQEPQSVEESPVLKPRAASHQVPAQSPLTMTSIAAKLAASEREADAARVRAKLRAARGSGGRGVQKPKLAASHGGLTEDRQENKADGLLDESEDELAHRGDSSKQADYEDEENVDPVKRDRKTATTTQGDQQKPEKRKRDVTKGSKNSAAASRRRSTLSPWELEALISGK